jgi:hypothetical protein
MNRIILTFSVIIISFSCYVCKDIYCDKISINEANRVIKEVIVKFGIEPYRDGKIYFVDEPITNADSIFSIKIEKLSDFKVLKKLKNSEFISRKNAMNNDSVRLYYGISFHKVNTNEFSVLIGSTFKGPLEQPRLDDGSIFAIFKYKIDKGRAKLVRFRFN